MRHAARWVCPGGAVRSIPPHAPGAWDSFGKTPRASLPVTESKSVRLHCRTSPASLRPCRIEQGNGYGPGCTRFPADRDASMTIGRLLLACAAISLTATIPPGLRGAAHPDHPKASAERGRRSGGMPGGKARQDPRRRRVLRRASVPGRKLIGPIAPGLETDPEVR